jgi:hypothetical protein
MKRNFSSSTPRATVRPYRGSIAPRAYAPRSVHTSFTGLIFGVTVLLFGLCVLRLACGLHEEGWNLERWTALGIGLWLARSAWRQVRGSQRKR